MRPSRRRGRFAAFWRNGKVRAVALQIVVVLAVTAFIAAMALSTVSCIAVLVLAEAMPSGAESKFGDARIRVAEMTASTMKLEFPNGATHTFSKSGTRWRLTSVTDRFANGFTILASWIWSRGLVDIRGGSP